MDCTGFVFLLSIVLACILETIFFSLSVPSFFSSSSIIDREKNFNKDYYITVAMRDLFSLKDKFVPMCIIYCNKAV